VRALELPEARLSRLELRVDGGIERGQALLLDLRALAELGGEDLRTRRLELGHRALLEGALLGERLQPRRFGVRLGLGQGRAPVEALAFEVEPRGRELGAGCGDLELRRIRRAFDLGVRQLDDHGVRGDGLARAHQHAVDARFLARRKPARLARLQAPGPAHLALERAFFHFVEVQLFPRDGGRAGLELRDADRDA
jgi:hypothetical protein